MRLIFTLISLCFNPAWMAAGELETRELKSKALGRTMKINILLPDGYGEDENRRYPVIYLLHGYGGDYTEWQRVGIVEEAAKLPVTGLLTKQLSIH